MQVKISITMVFFSYIYFAVLYATSAKTKISAASSKVIWIDRQIGYEKQGAYIGRDSISATTFISGTIRRLLLRHLRQ